MTRVRFSEPREACEQRSNTRQWPSLGAGERFVALPTHDDDEREVVGHPAGACTMAEPVDAHPLIKAIYERRTLDEIQLIVEADRSLVRRTWIHEVGFSEEWHQEVFLPLHYACFLGSSPEIVRYLLEKGPEAVRTWTFRLPGFEEDEECWTAERSLPVHLACDCRQIPRANNDSMPVVLRLLEAWPESIRERDGYGNLPVHYAQSLKLMQHLIMLWPESVREPGRGGEVLLHMASRYGDDQLPAVKFLLKEWPESVRATDEEGRIPLHALLGRCSTEVLDCLVKEWQESVRATDNAGQTPLHNISGLWSTEVIDCLLQHGGDEDLLLVRDDQGYLPLHSLFDDRGCNEEGETILQHIITRSPQSVRVRSCNGCLALHLALKDNVPESVIQILVGAWPQALSERNSDGDLPVHVAAKYEQFEHIEYLVQQYQESVEVQSSDGSLAVHLVLQHMSTWSNEERRVVRRLVDRFPRSVRVATNDGLLPLHVALERGFKCSRDDDEEGGEQNDIIRYLVRLAPESIGVASNEGLFPFDYAMRHSSPRTLRFLAHQWPDDSQGRTPLHVAASQVPPRPDMVRRLAELRPRLHGTRDRNGSLPLHAAVASQPSNPPGKAIVRYLAQQRPRSLLEGDHLGNIPLHTALARGVQAMGVVQLLLERQPDSTGVANRNGSLPLHVAVANCQPRNPSDLVSDGSEDDDPEDDDPEVADPEDADPEDADPEDADPEDDDLEDYDPDDDGPEDLDERPTPAVDLVKLLLEQHPGSVRHKDSDGNLPLLIAASSGADLDVLFVLARAWPNAIGGSSRSGPEQPPSPLRKRIKLSS